MSSSTTSSIVPFESAAHQRLDEAAVRASELVERLVEADVDENDSPWRQPDRILQQLNQARNDLSQAWKDYEQEYITSKKKTTPSLDPERCRALYMDMITDAFADTLENMRTTANTELDVDLLVDCLQSGLELLSEEDQVDLLLAPEEEGDRMDDGDNDLTIHEKLRREKGLR